VRQWKIVASRVWRAWVTFLVAILFSFALVFVAWTEGFSLEDWREQLYMGLALKMAGVAVASFVIYVFAGSCELPNPFGVG
jgi:hypothetical protein